MSLQQQMSLFQEGGLEQDGGTVDPVSGNEVPVGSAQEEVRDDIPAQLSEGEFVFPADVVRFIGLEKLMMMRQQAKAGLKRMEEMGQMGNSEEATMPDDMPFTIDDLDIEDEPTKMQTGGDVNPNTGTYTKDSKFKRTPQTPIRPVQPVQPIQTPNEEARFYNAPKESDPAPETPATYEELIGTEPYTYDELRKFVGPNGEIQYVAYKDGEPLPAYKDKVKNLLEQGFNMEDPDAVEETAPAETTVETARVTEDREGDSSSFQNMQQRENDIQQSYKTAIQKVMDSENISAEDAVQFIKDGKYTVMGKKVPGFLFPDIKLANQSRNQKGFIPFSLEEAAKQVQQQITSAEQFNEQGFVDDTGVGSDALGNTTNLKVASPSTTLGTTNVGSASIIPATVSDFQLGVPTASQTAGGATGRAIQDPSQIDPASLDKTETIDDALAKAQKLKEAEEADAAQARALAIAQANIKKKEDAVKAVALKEAEEKRMAVETARLNAIAAQQQKDNREAEAAAARQGSDANRGFTRDSSGRKNYKTGGIASKKLKKKKVMKRGGLASKK